MQTMKQKVREVLEGLDVESPDVSFDPGPDDYRIVAVVVSPSFETMDEVERLQMVWMAILAKMTDFEQTSIDTVFTFSPTEYNALMTGETVAESSP